MLRLTRRNEFPISCVDGCGILHSQLQLSATSSSVFFFLEVLGAKKAHYISCHLNLVVIVLATITFRADTIREVEALRRRAR